MGISAHASPTGYFCYMIHQVQLVVGPEIAFDPEARKKYLAAFLGVQNGPDFHERLLKRSIDARGGKVKVKFESQVAVGEMLPSEYLHHFNWKKIDLAPEVHIVGCGPAGMFAALRLIELGIKPIIIERGKDVRARRRDLAAINKDHVVNPDSNYCFGEGGAGTYSDGKLYTRSNKRGSVRRILEILVKHGASPDILFETHPHIGTNKLPGVVAAMRSTILDCGGEIWFNTKVEGFDNQYGSIRSLRLGNGMALPVKNVVLATGHSARDVYRALHQANIPLEAKPFAMGLRVEHPQQIINTMQYRTQAHSKFLPPASYSLVRQTLVQGRQRGVFSFCMCPGGFIVPAATGPSQVVVNGMSPSKRDSRFANSGMVVALEMEDMDMGLGAMAGLAMQEALEQRAWQAGGSTQCAPAQRLVDFVEGRLSPTLNPCSYIPGLHSANLYEVLGPNLGLRLRQALKELGRSLKPYYTNEANLVGVESRSSAPVRVPRHPESLQHPLCNGLYPTGEGAGFAGGIVSAAMDGERVANAIATEMGIGAGNGT